VWDDCSINIKIKREMHEYINRVELNNNGMERDVLGVIGAGGFIFSGEA
jgi:hypothetical protein